MKCSEKWLREWVNPDISRTEMADQLTMAGLEVEEIAECGDDFTIDVSITPNRGDCLSVRGLAREVAALTLAKYTPVTITANKVTLEEKLVVLLRDEAGCPRYVGRIIKGINPQAVSPEWLIDRLTKSGLKSIHPVVDVTNYVMLELGAPMHAFDLSCINNHIEVRLAVPNEIITLLDDSEKELDTQTLVIADQDKPLAIAGVMGGLDSSVTLTTTDVFLECAYFDPKVIARQRQRYDLNSDSSYRFERGVDATIQREAMERATELILTICGGSTGEITECISPKTLPQQTVITLPKEKVTKLLGIEIKDTDIEAIFARLSFSFVRRPREHIGESHSSTIWSVVVPPYRTDLILPEDIIEEVARVYGYNNIPTTVFHAALYVPKTPDDGIYLQSVRDALVHQGYHEIISYSFVDKQQQALLNPNEVAKELVNPITADMEVMRTNLWPGLVRTYQYNKSRQQARVRLFEIGACFLNSDCQLTQMQKIGGLAAGLLHEEQWGATSKEVDFYDVKNDLLNFLQKTYPRESIGFITELHPALHPGQSAAISVNGERIGWVGSLHPSVLQALDINNKLWVFEVNIPSNKSIPHKKLTEISKFPEIRRDLALLINCTVPAAQIQATIKESAGDWLKETFIFDVYQGKGIAPELKSVALALVLQHPTRTLIDDEVTEIINRVLAALKGKLGAELRS